MTRFDSASDDIGRRRARRGADRRRPKRAQRIAAALLLPALGGCSGDDPAAPGSPDPPALTLLEVASGLDRPVHLTAPPDDDRLFVVEQTGRIRVVRDGTIRATPFLDLSSAVSSGGERGLLGLAFHPGYAANGRFFVNYTDTDGDTRVVRYEAGPELDVADPASARLVLEIPQPFSNHNGGHVLFGPDGMLYVAVGDGGSAGDPDGNGQDPTTLLGTILRLDVDGGEPYAVPPDNPFAQHPTRRPEIWLFGLRNPWRLAFDPDGGDLYVADVGQSRREEITVVGPGEGGANLGWNVVEGTRCFADPDCTPDAFTLPVVEYGHEDGCSVTGGHVYRGSIDALRGHYFYSDYCGGWLRSFRHAAGAAMDETEWDVPAVGNVTSFGEDAAGELYVLSETAVYRLASSASGP